MVYQKYFRTKNTELITREKYNFPDILKNKFYNPLVNRYKYHLDQHRIFFSNQSAEIWEQFLQTNFNN